MSRTKLHEEASNEFAYYNAVKSYNRSYPNIYDDPSRIIEILKKDPKLINVQDDNGLTALHYTMKCGSINKAKALFDRGAKPDIEDKDGHTAIYYAMRQSHMTLEMSELIIKMFSQTNIGVNKQYDKDKTTLLHIASAAGNVEMVNFFLSKGANKTIKNVRGETPADVIRERMGKAEFLQSLRLKCKKLVDQGESWKQVWYPEWQRNDEAQVVLQDLEDKLGYLKRVAEILEILEPFGPELSSSAPSSSQPQSIAAFWKNKKLLVGGAVVGLTAVAAAAVVADVIDVPECKIS